MLTNYHDFFIYTDASPVARILHPRYCNHDVNAVSRLLRHADSVLGDAYKLVLSGGGLITMDADQDVPVITPTRGEPMLDYLLASADTIIQSIRTMTPALNRDYIIGLDLIVRSRKRGQFALFLDQSGKDHVVWKGYPYGGEDRWLAGFGTDMGRQSPRTLQTNLGKTGILVCHDAQTFNRKNRAAVMNTTRTTDRQAGRQALVLWIRSLLKINRAMC